MPIGGKRFEFSEFPEEGEGAPKQKKTAKKPPPKFANKKAET